MGDAKRRAEIRDAHEKLLSEPWPCANCEKTVQFIVQNGYARCPNCSYYGYRRQFGFAVTNERFVDKAEQ